MPKNLSRAIISALLPPGSIWEPEDGGNLDLLFDGMSDNLEAVREFVSNLSDIREPQKTIILTDLEKEFGITFNDSITEQTQRNRLYSAKYKKNSDGSSSHLQDRLRTAGFDVFVHINDPPIDPGLFLNSTFKTVCGNSAAICGAAGVICGTANSNKLLVNGNLIFHPGDLYQISCGSASAVSGAQGIVCGRFHQNTDTNDVTYALPSTSDYDHLVFFVGGDVTRDGVTGEIITISPAQLEASRRDEFESIILSYKPMHSWAGLVVEYTL
jgi:hypothetical protein